MEPSCSSCLCRSTWLIIMCERGVFIAREFFSGSTFLVVFLSEHTWKKINTVEWVKLKNAAWAGTHNKDTKKSKISVRRVNFEQVLTSRQKRRQASNRVQKTYGKDRTPTAKLVLGGEWESTLPASVAKAMFFFQVERLMEANSSKDNRSHQAKDERNELREVMTEYEADGGIKKASKSARGPDMVSLEILRKVKVDVLSVLFN